MSNNNIKETLDSMMVSLKAMVDSNAVIGDPVTLPDGTILVPICKVGYGFASGGGNMGNVTKNGMDGIGAAGGGGLTITPVAFISVHNGESKLLQIEPFVSSIDRIIDKMPEVIDKVGDFIDEKTAERAKKKEEKKAAELAAQEKAEKVEIDVEVK